MKKVSAGAAALSLIALTACSGKAPPPAPAPAQVRVVRVQATSVPLARELVGRLTATRVADVRARIPGILLERRYTEGSDVVRGQVLFQIDPAPLRAALSAADAALTQAQANATNARVLAARTRELSAKGWASRAELDTSEANERSTAAQVGQAQANLEAARINLGYATVRSPIAGRAGEQQVTEGALVGQSEATLLTTVEQIDPLYVNFDQSAAEMLQLRSAQNAGKIQLAAPGKVPVEIVLPDGTVYNNMGVLNFASASVDPSTSSLALRAEISNPNRLLLPGMFVTVRLTLGERPDALLVPQSALMRDAAGAYVLVVDGENKAAERRIKTAGTLKSDWVVSEGLAPGDAVIVTGLQQLRPGAPVQVAQ